MVILLYLRQVSSHWRFLHIEGFFTSKTFCIPKKSAIDVDYGPMVLLVLILLSKGHKGRFWASLMLSIIFGEISIIETTSDTTLANRAFLQEKV